MLWAVRSVSLAVDDTNLVEQPYRKEGIVFQLQVSMPSTSIFVEQR